MRVVTLAAISCVIAGAQTPSPDSDPAYAHLSKAYSSLKNHAYDDAIALFLRAIEAAPARVSIRNDLAYTYLKIGENDAARDQFGEAMRLDPSDAHVALEYGFLCHETKRTAEARRIFDRVRKSGDPTSRATAEKAFNDIDGPLRMGIERWTAALASGGNNFSAHHEIAELAERRDEVDRAAEHYLKAWRLSPQRRFVLVELGRAWKALNRVEDANAALLAASRGGEARTAEAARELLPHRYPYVYEFRGALDLDPSNVELRRELAYLLLRMGHKDDAQREFTIITETAPEDLLSAAQLGFLYLARNDRAQAMPLLERVLKGGDRELANRVRAVLQLPQTPAPQERSQAASPEVAAVEARLMAERSLKAGYLKDALKYLKIAHETDPLDFSVMLQLGWAYNMLRDDGVAIRWFDLARQSPDAKISRDAGRAFENLRPAFARIRTTAWVYPFYSSRWHDIFSYGQVKTEFKIGKLPLRPYLSTRFAGDTRRTTGGALPQYLSESAIIFGAGIATRYWRGIMAWGEAGSSMSYLGRHSETGRMIPDYRGGVAFARGWGHSIHSETSGTFFETNADGVFVSRFGNDFITSSQNRFGFTPVLDALGGLRAQFYWNGNLTMDSGGQAWANFAEFGPGLRLRWAGMPPSLTFSVNLVRGVYTIRQYERKPHFYDVRVGFWYAATR